MDLPIYQDVKENIKYLYELYAEVHHSGGLVAALATN